jgi:hypothetical protein
VKRGSIIFALIVVGGCALVGGLDGDYTLLAQGGANGAQSGGASANGGASSGGASSNGGASSGGASAQGGTGGAGGMSFPRCMIDTAMNGTETDVDCGGPDCPQCANAKMCTQHSDCVSGRCSALNVCGPWAIRFGAAGNSVEVRDVAYLPNGNLAIVGSFTGLVQVGPSSLSTTGGQDIFVANVDAEGNVAWSQRYGGNGDDEPFRVAATSGGDIIVVAACQSANIGTLIGQAGGRDGCVFKVSGANGTAVWATSFGSNGSDAARALVLDGGGNVLVAGDYTASNVSITGCSFTGSHAGQGDVVVAKLDSAGSCLWARRWGSSAADAAHAIALRSSDLYIAGEMGGAIDFGLGSDNPMAFGGSDIFVARLNQNDGAATLAKGYGGGGDDSARSVAVAQNGDVVLGGDIEGAANLGVSVNGVGHSGFVARYSPAGAHLWNQILGATATSNVRVADVFLSGDVLAVSGTFAGNAQSFAGTTLSSNGDDVFAVRLDAVNNVGTGVDGYGQANQPDVGRGSAMRGITKNLLLVGSFSGSITFGSDSLSAAGDADGFVASLGTDP